MQLKEILMSPAERADIIVDFASVKLGKNVTLLNFGPDAPYGGGGFRRADPLSTGQVMQFRVNQSLPASFVDPTTPPAQLVMPTIPAPVIPDMTRRLALLELAGPSGEPEIPIEARLGTFDANVGAPTGITYLRWEDPITENPTLGDTETWELYNFTEDVHPIHIHDVLPGD